MDGHGWAAFVGDFVGEITPAMRRWRFRQTERRFVWSFVHQMVVVVVAHHACGNGVDGIVEMFRAYPFVMRKLSMLPFQ